MRMTVQELVDELGEADPGAIVVLYGDEDRELEMLDEDEDADTGEKLVRLIFSGRDA